MISVIEYTGWKFYDDYTEIYGRNYLTHHVGSMLVPVSRIKGLTHENVLSEEKLSRLLKSIETHGYVTTGSSHMDINLTLFPNGEFCVGNGGNHRPYLAKKLGITIIRAIVDVCIPLDLLTDEQILHFESLDPYDLPNNPELKDVAYALELMPSQQLAKQTIIHIR
ncbi:hypothetical protein CN395_02280 [Priestia megaterium]|jgi:hypothetical protein|uniref:hypothetical protein n=3 Tax=Priestia megaterium TaxID=1404 RepID=UPI0006FDD926|nr:hypothetical protein ASG61_05935 [Bacillus sp. Leaf75]PEU65478.1 hypothetical protein CN395_02280 [Priestia megaterium]